jgi:hypothetical protein
LPVAVLGSSSTKVTAWGALKCATNNENLSSGDSLLAEAKAAIVAGDRAQALAVFGWTPRKTG